jgi:hypothetical protein
VSNLFREITAASCQNHKKSINTPWWVGGGGWNAKCVTGGGVHSNQCVVNVTTFDGPHKQHTARPRGSQI